jgi:hypothetical protein
MRIPPLATMLFGHALDTTPCAPRCSSVDVFCVLTRQCVLYVIHEAESFHRAAYVRDAAVSFTRAVVCKAAEVGSSEPRESCAP